MAISLILIKLTLSAIKGTVFQQKQESLFINILIIEKSKKITITKRNAFLKYIKNIVNKSRQLIKEKYRKYLKFKK